MAYLICRKGINMNLQVKQLVGLAIYYVEMFLVVITATRTSDEMGL